MKYKINNIFYSLQGEAFHAGKASVFVRFSICNLKCHFCDTDFASYEEYTKEELESAVEKMLLEYGVSNPKDVNIIFTGGEPALQLKEDEPLFEGYYRTIETNGTKKVPSWLEWVTVSPKMPFIKPENVDEIKTLLCDEYMDFINTLEESYPYALLYIQPLELNGKMNIEECLDFVKKHPRFKLSLQTHKLVGFE